MRRRDRAGFCHGRASRDGRSPLRERRVRRGRDRFRNRLRRPNTLALRRAGRCNGDVGRAGARGPRHRGGLLMTALRAALARFADLRRGEGSLVARAAGGLFLILAAHTTLETARDTLLLTRFPPSRLGVVYVAVALTVLPHAMLMAWLSARIGARKAVVGGLV